MTRKWKQIFPVLTVVLGMLILGFNLSLISHIQRMDHFVIEKKTGQIQEKLSQNDVIESIIKRMSLKEKVGQLIVVNYYGGDLDQVIGLISNYSLSGIMLKSENVRPYTYDEIKKNNLILMNSSGRIPLILSVDQEGGSVARLNGVIRSFPFPADVYEQKGEPGIHEMASYMSGKLRDLNINVNFSPVVDVVYKTNSVIYKRSFSSNAQLNAELARVYLDDSRQNHVIAVLKHFPGYGNVGLDPHQEVSIDSTSTLSDLAEPFLKMPGVEMIMSSHVIYTRYDDRPGTLSPVIMSYLRKNSYSNVIITDDIQMKCITRIMDYRQASIQAIQAGCDIVLSVTQDKSQWVQNAESLCQAILSACQSGEIPEERLNESLRRVIRMKLDSFIDNRWGILSDEEKKSLDFPVMKTDERSNAYR